MDPTMARKTWRSLEAVHGMIYFTPDAAAEYAAIGVTDRRGGYVGDRFDVLTLLRAIGRVLSARVVEAGLLPGGRAERPAE
ncbi:MAG TPA: hypothetical protein VMM60_11450 [Ilumatobacter sp.]|nr:hypothetical protein [Ilumatobacter sp.]